MRGTNRSRSTQASESPSTPSVSTSATINISREYALAIHTASYNEIWADIHRTPNLAPSGATAHGDEAEIIHRLLRPSKSCIDSVLVDAPPTRFSSLVSCYVDSSEQTSLLCLSLRSCVGRARSIYAPITNLLELIPMIVGDRLSSDPSHPALLTPAQSEWAFNIFCRFDSEANPFTCMNVASNGNSTFQGLRHCFLELKEQLDLQLWKARRRWLLLYRIVWVSAIFLVASTTALTIVALLLASHAMAALLAVSPVLACRCFCLPSSLNMNTVQDQIDRLDAVAKGIYVLNNDIDTIERLVASLHNTIESDKMLVRIGLAGGVELRHSVEEVVRQLHKNHSSLLRQLTDLEEHICIYFAAVNRARSALLLHLTAKPSI